LTGGIKLEKKSLSEIEEVFQGLRSKFEELNQDAVRETKFDLPMVSEKWLNQILKGNLKLNEKKRLLLTQMGYLRMNIFMEYYERVKLARSNNDLDKAVDLMNEHAEIARVFIITPKPSVWERRLKKLLSIKSIEPIEYLQKWQNLYEGWRKKNEPNQPQLDDKKQLEEFDKLRMAFLELYTFSFSVENFPPLRYKRSDH
jgi:hypothetical protein